jgi:ubiquinone/menaquinone biosynthesis C-methylase UbiE
MSFRRFMAAQLRKPSGWFGSVIMRRMLNRMNIEIVTSTLARLELQPQHDVLEIGFGGGAALALVAKQLTTGVASGVDFSPEMVTAAQSRFKNEISNGRIRVQFGDVSQLPFSSASFDRVFTINTIYFWPDPSQAFAEIRRVLKPAGLAVIALRSRENMQRVALTQHGFRLFDPDEVRQLMQDAGFHNILVTHEKQGSRFDELLISGTS